MNRQRLLLIALTVALVGGMAAAGRLRADAPPVIINEMLAGNADTNLDPDYFNYVPWVELRNTGPSAVALGGFRLTDNLAAPSRWIIPAGTTIPANGYLILWLDGKASGRHAPYTLGMSGELGLFMADGTPVDTVTFDPQRPDVSFGRAPDAAEWRYFDPPTPGAANPAGGHLTPAQADPPALDPPGGHYAAGQSVALSAEPGATIRYTIDGSRPTVASPVYTAPIAVSAPTAIRARAFADGRLPSPAATATYLIGVEPGIAVVAFATEPAHFFDNQIGIYVDGKNGIANTKCGKRVGNWNRPWERPVSVEFYEEDGDLAFQQDGGIRITGSCTRRYPQKHLAISVGARYGTAEIAYPLIPDKPLTAYHGFILRTGGQDSANTLLRDALGQQVVSGRMDVDRQGYRPAIVFINGAYWGIYSLREDKDAAYVTSTYGLGLDEFDLLEDRAVVVNGSADAWNALYNYLKANDPAKPEVYAYLKTQIDIDEFINYQILEIYADNIDWPHNNNHYWRARDGGRWRWIAYDLDASFGRATKGYVNNTFKFAAAAGGKRAYNAFILRRLMNSPEFKAEFGQRFAAHMNTTYQPARVVALINSMAAAIAPRIPAHVARWKEPKSVTYWQSEIGRLRTFAELRPGYLWGFLNDFLKSPGLTTLTVNHNAAQGRVTVAGVEAPAHYEGAHFRTLPVRLAAEPLPGFAFVEWAETGETDPTPAVVLSGPATWTAVFEEN